MEEIEGSAKPLESNMLFYLERTGGIAGQRKIVMLNTELLPSEDARQLNKMVNDAGFFSLPEKLPEKKKGADLFFYRLTVEKFALSFSEGKKHTVEGNQLNIPAKLQSLIKALETQTIPVDQGKIITLADDGKKIALKVNETLALKLGTEYDWNIAIDDITIISRDPLAIYKEDIQGIYVAHKEGTIKLTAIGEPVCRKEEPPCEAPTRKFSIQVVVNKSKQVIIEGTKWLLSSLNNKSVLKDSSITLTFADGSIGGSAGCNTYGSKYTANDAGSLTIQDSIVVTKMFCGKPEGIMQQEQEYLDLLLNVTEYTIRRNNLILKTTDNRELVFRPLSS
jgi:heat shock protein HslJ